MSTARASTCARKASRTISSSPSPNGNLPQRVKMASRRLGHLAFDLVYADLSSDLSGAQTSNGSPVRSNNEGSSFSGLFTRVDMGHIVMGSDGWLMIRSL